VLELWCCPNGHGMQVCDWPHDQEVIKTFTLWSTLDYRSVGLRSKSLHGGATLKQLFCNQSQSLASAILALSLISAGIEPHRNDMDLTYCNLLACSYSNSFTRSKGWRQLPRACENVPGACCSIANRRGLLYFNAEVQASWSAMWHMSFEHFLFQLAH